MDVFPRHGMQTNKSDHTRWSVLVPFLEYSHEEANQGMKMFRGHRYLYHSSSLCCLAISKDWVPKPGRWHFRKGRPLWPLATNYLLGIYFSSWYLDSASWNKLPARSVELTISIPSLVWAVHLCQLPELFPRGVRDAEPKNHEYNIQKHLYRLLPAVFSFHFFGRGYKTCGKTMLSFPTVGAVSLCPQNGTVTLTSQKLNVFSGRSNVFSGTTTCGTAQ
jgi:hypothetical protein